MVVWKFIIVYHQLIVSATETSYKMAVNVLSKIGLKELGFCPKAEILYITDYTIWLKFRQHLVQVRIK